VLQPDVFIHTWSVSDEVNERAKQLYSPVQAVFEELSDVTFNVDKMQIFKTRRGVGNIKVENVFHMYRKMRLVNMLKAAQEEKLSSRYDLVIRARFDSWILHPISSADLNVAKHNIIIPNFGDYGGGIFDQFAFGASRLMDVYNNVLPNIVKYWWKGCLFHPEQLLLYHLESKQISIKRSGYKVGLYKNNDIIYPLKNDWRMQCISALIYKKPLIKHRTTVYSLGQALCISRSAITDAIGFIGAWWVLMGREDIVNVSRQLSLKESVLQAWINRIKDEKCIVIQEQEIVIEDIIANQYEYRYSVFPEISSEIAPDILGAHIMLKILDGEDEVELESNLVCYTKESQQ